MCKEGTYLFCVRHICVVVIHYHVYFTPNARYYQSSIPQMMKALNRSPKTTIQQDKKGRCEQNANRLL
jgi:hypothetical protein